MTPAPTLPDSVQHLLRERFGHQHFRPGQAAIIEAILQGHHVLTVMPTGSGKSLCYQLPALLKDGCTLVISPLIALMKDQVDSLLEQGIAATFVNSSLSAQEQLDRLYACRSGRYKLLYVAPERFRSPRFLQAMAQTRVALFAVDEAHCISQWGHDFRPDYLRLQQAIEHLQHPQVLALTATATVEVQDDIVRQLGCQNMQRFVSGFDRPNLTYRVLNLKGPAAKLPMLGKILDAQTDGSSIIYAATRRAVEEIATFLHERGTEALIYHAGLRDAERQRAQDAFMAGQCRLIIATNAFGMGVDKPDVRCVVHFNLPRSMEAYYQEAGRAGRDGLPAECVLLFSYGDVRIQEFLLEQSYPARDLLQEVYGAMVYVSRERADIALRMLLPLCRRGLSEMHLEACARLLEKAGYIERVSVYDTAEDHATSTPNTLIRLATEAVTPRQLAIDDEALQQRKQHELHKMRRMVGYANAQQCRREKMLAYFGEQWTRHTCGACDNCLDDGAFAPRQPSPKRFPSETEWVIIQKILSCIARMQGRYGRVKVIQVLLGSQASEIVNSPLRRLSTYGILKGTSRSLLDVYLDALIEATCVHIVGDEFPKLDLTSLGQAVMRRQQRVLLALPALAAVTPTSASTRSPATTSTVWTTAPTVPSLTPTVVHAPAAPLSYDEALFERLRTERSNLARAETLPPYCIFNDRSLREMATVCPTTPAGFLQIYGV
ncbi:MAG: ATP-dependent DNA helicase RecQ, partial [Candidatus Tectomicrobia bacterium]|nr:ATP-dependent DNA helicase RecQ [Candidatus Tectomicrobia bacterium]